MNSQRFSKTNLIYCYSNKYSGSDKTTVPSIANHLSESITSKSFHFGEITKGSANGKAVFHYKTIKDNMALEKLNDNLKRAYYIKPSNRDEIIYQIKVLLQENYPKHICRLDIKNFFESFDKEKIKNKIKNDRVVSNETLYVLSEFFDNIEGLGISGIPRGMSIATTLSEIVFQEIDRQLKNVGSSYYYARFVDDILILSSDEPKEKMPTYTNIIERHSFRFNRKRGKFSLRNMQEGKGSGKIHLDYLGYRFIADKNVQKNKRPDLQVKISPRKVNKIKSRIIKSLISYSHDKDLSLLIDRIKFLSGQYPVYRNSEKIGSLRSGLTHSYKEITETDQLKDLDDFKAKALFSRKGSLERKYTSSISPSDKWKIARISFLKSYTNKRFYNFSLSRISEIMKAFRD